ncbi:MAG: glycosyltransferase family 4 protein [Actinobacteria bacterium]|nr:glycosyltransferase family 4 protein [Actinomycetota bacterium]
MSILVVCPRFAPDTGGIETLLAQVLPELSTRGLEIVVAAGTGREDHAPVEVLDGIPVYRIPFDLPMHSAKPAGILEAAHRIRMIEADHEVRIRHVHGFGDIGLWYALRAHQRRPLPLVVSVHGTFESLGRLAPSAEKLLRAADVVTAVSGPVRSAVYEAIPDLAAEVRLIPNGLRFVDTAPTTRPVAGQLLGVGRLLEQKGFDIAVEALARLRATHPSCQLMIAGDGQCADAIRRQAKRSGVASRVHLLGNISREDMRRAMNDASIVLVPSRHTEGFSLAALEAAHAARPVIASGIGGLVETVENGVTGLLVPPDDPGALARAIARMLDDPVGAAAMGQVAHERARERFAFERCVDAYHGLYVELDSPALLSTASRV